LSLERIISIALRQNPRMTHAGVIINEHTLTASQTRQHVEILSRWFDFIHHDELLSRLQRPRRRPFCLLTFDDGKRSVYAETAPELQRLGVPAVFYVTTHFLSRGQPLWFDRYEALLATLPCVPFGLEPATVKQLPFALLSERIDRACEQYGVSIDPEHDETRAMSWEEARELCRRGFTVGAHGFEHAVLTRESESDALRGIERSIADVSAHTGAQCATFSFPNGNYTAGLALHALECGVSTVMTTEPVWADTRFPPWRLPRLQLFGPQGRLKIDLKLALAATGRVLANPDGTGRLYRKVTRRSAELGPGATPIHVEARRGGLHARRDYLQ
jgi:peptidoglycan/xylan/chitin deacetylase (PgdA/CDA1 family)